MGYAVQKLGAKVVRFPRMTERHYAHLSPNYVADTDRAALPALGIVDKKGGGHPSSAAMASDTVSWNVVNTDERQ